MTEPADHPDNVLRIERRFSAPPEMVFAMFTRPELVRVWNAASHGFRAQDVQIDARPGGVLSLRNVKPGVEEREEGVFHEVRPHSRLVWSYRYLGTDFFSTVSVDLTPNDGSTRMAFRQTGFPDSGSRDEHAYGWNAVLAMMETALLAGSGATRFAADRDGMDGFAADLEAARKRFEAEQTTGDTERA
ncbi:hypothetical protein EF888_12410 [Silicimonas algicola]|uniref:Uncharacterized protein YndB with AHSA1/START domain n=1 Tax=Silicimonas algicola TaxID=1826607 RepID=A0A316GCJ0_9RHOB|nr:SRPBCC family protein [Silicimonas algicola]AZQ67867.1 hypothetical protein EF888_12410 [Silicimonas algicola]PWK57706.1 uncharacterized protein YndB with AHSA1/START domain [Silicimonas algicola]